MKTAGTQRRLLLAVAWVGAVMLAGTLLYPARNMLSLHAPQRYFPPDFMQFYFAGQLAADGRVAQLYNQAAHEPLVRGVGLRPEQVGRYPIIRPAFVAYLCIPLTWFSYRTALLLVTLGNLALLGVLAWKLPAWFSLPRSWSVGLFAFYPFVWSIGFAQDILLLTALMAYSLYSVSRGHPARGGILLGLCVFKPHLVWLVPVAWLAGGKRKAAGWFIATALTLALISFLSVGVNGVREWMGLLQQPYSDYKPETMGNLRALALHFGPAVAFLAGGLVLACLGLILWRGSWSQKLSAAVLAALLLSPHTYSYDFSLLAVVALLTAHAAVRYAVLLPWPYFYPVTDQLPWILGMLAYLVVMAARPADRERVCPSV
jgi:hypothetical protein